ncbi:hypothetical protein [Isoptericola sp. NPDC057191]|uniref:hypothetical protein n=1 Tax=Isoptericola sp. NPDC057191 TaxID=3346041 RepID=UPI003645D284
MALLPRLRQLLRRPFSASTVAARRQSPSESHGEHLQEDALRTMLTDDPNDARAFRALAEIVRRRAAESPNAEDPLTAPSDEAAQQRAADLAVWSLAEELAGHPRAWRPLLELGRLSVVDDPEGASRRLATAASRDASGEALAEGLAILREARMPTEALGLGIGHWRVREHTPEVGRHLVLAALEAERYAEARQHLESLTLHPGTEELRAELSRIIAAREPTTPR